MEKNILINTKVIKKTGQQSALLIAHGKVGGLNTVAVGYNFAFGGVRFSQRENEHFLSAKTICYRK